ncbi:hypothetical protein HPB51_021105 [Rhipicephalus microplus]|uniref:DDE Tnp4 domain-containing protein n=1 Tax=Rhipicephalus microplus TaxID=6941 RepID=A0A9J6E3K2_RHIMP|nr:hypothetical protein HPB51_021105 [Rhipicephalus microplus]
MSSILWDPYCLAHLSWEDIEALMLREHASRGGLLNLDSMSSQCVRRQFRYEKADFPVFVRALKMPQYITSAQGVRVTAADALCICLRRLAYPNRLCDLQEYFGRHYSVVVESIEQSTLPHRKELPCPPEYYEHSPVAETFGHGSYERSAPLRNCWAFIDDTARPICRPSQDQRLYFSGPKRLHVLKYQTLICLNGLICQLDGPYPGRRHDAGILRDSELYEKLEALTLDKEFVIYGDPAYPLRPLLMKPYGGAALTAAQQKFNSSMSARSLQVAMFRRYQHRSAEVVSIASCEALDAHFRKQALGRLYFASVDEVFLLTEQDVDGTPLASSLPWLLHWPALTGVDWFIVGRAALAAAT